MIHINLLPGATRKRSTGTRLDLRTALAGATAHIDKFAVGAGAAVFVAVALVGLMMFTQGGRAQQLSERERKAVQDSARFAAVLRDRQQAEASRNAVLRQLAIIQSIDDRRYVWPHILEEVSRNLPPFTWISTITQTSAPPSAAVVDSVTTALKEKGDTSAAGKAKMQEAQRNAAVAAARASTKFRIVGNTVDIQALTRFMRDLEASPFIRRVQLNRSDLVVVEQKEVTEFQLDAESERPDSTVIEVQALSLESR
jgi:Tfp pilus assembly protein PilN